MKHANRIDRRFSYTSAADSAKPGYLKAKFDKERKRLAELKAKAEAEALVVQSERELKVRRIAK